MSQRVQSRPPVVLRVELNSVKPAFDLPSYLTDFAVLGRPEDAPAIAGHPGRKIPEDVTCIMDIFGIHEATAIPYAINMVSALRIASTSAISIGCYVQPNAPIIEGFDDGPHWGHYDESLSTESAVWVERHLEELRPYLIADSYSRVANGMRLYGAALETNNSDLALLGFVGAIESLFSIAPQELSFRLSLLLAKFLGGAVKQQRNFFGRARELYKVRSKIAHGDRIDENEEAAAIQVTERWTPEAEELSRLSIRQVIDQGLIDVFNSPRDHENLLIELLFR